MNESSRIADVKVGIFVLAALAVLIVGSLWVAGSTQFRVRYVPYKVLMKGSAGVQAGDHVRFAGVKVGRVDEVKLEPESEWPVVMRVKLAPTVPLREGSTAKISASGLMGASFLMVELGPPDAPRLPPGGKIYGVEQAGFEEALSHVDVIAEKTIALLDQVSRILDDLSNDIGPVLSGAQQLLSDENAAKIGEILMTLDATLDESGPRISSMLARLDALAAKLESGADDLPELTGELRGLVSDVRKVMGPDGERLVVLLETAQDTLTSADQSLAILGDNRDELEWAIRDLRDTSANLAELSQGLKERPSSLIWGSGEKERRPGDGVEGSR